MIQYMVKGIGKSGDLEFLIGLFFSLSLSLSLFLFQKIWVQPFTLKTKFLKNNLVVHNPDP